MKQLMKKRKKKQTKKNNFHTIFIIIKCKSIFLSYKKIYTKQINLDGTSSIKIYELVETPSTQAAAFPAMNNLVTKEEFSKTINSLLQEIAQLKEEKEQNQEKPQQEFNF